MNLAASLVGFLPSTDLNRSQKFFVDLLGLELLELTPHALVLDSAGTELRVTQVASLSPHPFTVLGWSVPDLPTAVRELSERGLTFSTYEGLGQDTLGIWTAPDGTGVAWFNDPDQNVLSLHSPP